MSPNKILILGIILMAFAITTYNSVRAGGIVGYDYGYHVGLAESWLHGGPITTNFGIYPPLFHLFMAGLILLQILPEVSLILQVCFYPLVIASTTYISYRLYGGNTAAISALIMFGSFAVFDRASQVIPQNITLIFIPLAVLFFLKGKTLPFAACTAIALFSHGIYAVPAVFAMWVYSLKNTGHIRLSIIGLIILLPVAILAAYTLPQMIGFAGEVTNPQAARIFAEPAFFVEYAGFLPVLALILGFFAWKLKEYPLFVAWILFTVPLLFIEPDRFASLIMPPCAVLGGAVINRWLKTCERKRFYVLLALFVSGFFGSFIHGLMV